MNFNNNDNPITNRKDDILGFESLAKRIANSITSSNINTKNSFTISIEGQWGTGKTSLVNLIKNEIKDEVIILKFNPWMINDFEQLIKYFFSEFIKIIMKEIPWHKPYKRKIIKNLKSMASFLTPDNIRVGTKSFSTTYKTKDLFFSEPTIYELNSEINAHLKQLNKRIVIIVDDIDRLTDKETETFFRLIKGIADFDNLIYLLLYDKAIVSKSLEQFKQENGEKYLDKIVQYSISIPKVYPSELNRILVKKIDIILDENPNHYFNKEKWDILLPNLDNYIMNIRDINKVMNVVSFEYPQISKDVNFFDFFILSLIKVQNYALYEELKYNKHQFHEEKINRLADNYDKKKEELIIRLNENLNNFEKYQPLLQFLIPNLDPYNNFYIHKKHEDKSAVYKEYFNNYFTFSVAKYGISQKEYDEIIQKLSLANFVDSNNFSILLKIKKNEGFFLEIFKEQTLNSLVDDIITTNILINLLSIPYNEYSMISFSIEVLKRIENIDMILKLIYFNGNSISLKTKLEFYRDIKEEENNIVSNLFLDIDKKLISEVEALSIQDLLKKDKEDKFNFEYFQWISSFFPSLSNTSLKKEIPNLIFNSQKDFFEILNLFKIKNYKGKIVFDKKCLSDYIHILEVEKYIKSLVKVSSDESLLLEFWNKRSEYS